ncbi:hypothetical protein XH83_37675 (plasmid) [Bradyrhizobium sp. CCBAU 53351]|uniref:Uncharacterized protein n=2 Tax=Bradyrhizobium TaxID=374 RepID=A0AAE5X9D3_9BRAD|nr:hypothetical protein X265_38335 [Bradyrhizobium guangdongense]QAU51255.1 hypothetical protein XH91_37535 [Bradyrhizobium guangzhouense]QOZ49852.1 hypothetical protein XH89_38725 [Bradyrhizobium sp. CCBAU 53340]QOZ56546.1 hypothetical protein XH90_34520 [Bradyrhizobium sp. CCBAU 53338]QOZ81191.1 hypothetical protein XH83_37675 [Bradyrhizobium sp. CCBAU 53351]
MVRNEDQFKRDPSPNLVRFPQSRVSPARRTPAKDLGLSLLSRRLGLPERQLTGHWCSRCEGIWYGYLLEVDCPACGNRHG